MHGQWQHSRPFNIVKMTETDPQIAQRASRVFGLSYIDGINIGLRIRTKTLLIKTILFAIGL